MEIHHTEDLQPHLQHRQRSLREVAQHGEHNLGHGARPLRVHGSTSAAQFHAARHGVFLHQPVYKAASHPEGHPHLQPVPAGIHGQDQCTDLLCLSGIAVQILA